MEGESIKVTAAGEECTVMFEPSGMTYELHPDEFLIAELVERTGGLTEVVAWSGGVSVWPAGPVRIRNSSGVVLHELP